MRGAERAAPLASSAGEKSQRSPARGSEDPREDSGAITAKALRGRLRRSGRLRERSGQNRGASAPGRGARAWVVQEVPTLTALDDTRATLRPVWVLVDLLALVTCLVLAAPERRRQR